MKRAFPLLLAALSFALPAGATSYVMMSDADLADGAAAIAAVKVLAVESAPTGDLPSTDVLVEVESIAKGFVPGSTLVVRTPGGVSPNGLGLKIWGAPRFVRGERALLFLNPREDGTFRVAQLMLGAFHLREIQGVTYALRDLSEAREVARTGAAASAQPGEDRLRDYARFSRWLEDRAAGRQRAADYLAAVAPGPVEANFAYLLPEDGIAIRWFRFDTGLSVKWKVHQSGQPGLSLDQTSAAFRAAMDAWNGDNASNVNDVFDGTTNASAGLRRSDDVNTLLFNDPGDQVDGTFSCDSGGVIAAGGPFFFTSTREFRGTRYHEAVEADIVTNDGTECFFSGSPKTAEEIFAHELGHTLGLGHSRERQALMFANAHADERGASLTGDDRAGIQSLYGTGAPPPPPPPPTGLKAPTELKAVVVSRTRIDLTWKENATVEEKVLVEMKRIGGAWRQIRILAANAKSVTIAGLKPGTAYAFRVRVQKGATYSDYSNTVRPPKLPA